MFCTWAFSTRDPPIRACGTPFKSRSASDRYLALEKLVAVPIIYGTYQIPAAVLTQGGTLREVPTAVQVNTKRSASMLHISAAARDQPLQYDL